MLKKSALILLLCTSLVYAVCSPPGTGDWTISSSEQCDGQDVIINGDVFVQGSLTLNTTNMSLNCSTDREFNIFVNGSLTGWNSAFYRTALPFDITVNETATIAFNHSTFTNGSRIFLIDNSSSTFINTSFHDDIFARENSTNNWHDITVGKFEENSILTTVELSGTSETTINNSVFEGTVDFGFNSGDTAITHVFASNFTNSSDFRGEVLVNFTSSSHITATGVYAHTPTVTGAVQFATSVPNTLFAATNYTRIYPTQVVDQFGSPVGGVTVTITNASGAVFANETTNAQGRAYPTMQYTSSYCGSSAANCDDDFNITTSTSQVLGLQTETPITFMQYVSPVPEFSTVLLLLVAGIFGSFFVYKKYHKA
ncbi:hypothetical protein GF342_04625 [Candidatus Woesearchaeota archaeon]|nr:hypothetical protein [Candidatus Woesearchaeota archaeon]